MGWETGVRESGGREIGLEELEFDLGEEFWECIWSEGQEIRIELGGEPAVARIQPFLQSIAVNLLANSISLVWG